VGAGASGLWDFFESLAMGYRHAKGDEKDSSIDFGFQKENVVF
jgi:hypothetical protein